jgi:transcriptional regulator with XRE-family HTH domain
MKLYEKLQMLRKDRKLSQEELADAIGISRQAVAKWEQGQTYPDIDNLIRLSELYKVSIDRLVKDEGDCSKEFIENVNTKGVEIVEFLIRAKSLTYASHSNETTPSRIASHDYEYSEGDLRYQDTYLGGERFAGEEAVWYQGLPVFSMNYVGRVLHDSFSGDFLKEALLHVPEDIPYRGPLFYQNGDYSYHCNVSGEFHWFQGYEEIFCQGIKVFECYFHGGNIK